MARKQQKTIGHTVSDLAPAPRLHQTTQDQHNGMPLLPVSRHDAVVTLDVVNALRDEAA